jgi:hypothetical protein
MPVVDIVMGIEEKPSRIAQALTEAWEKVTLLNDEICEHLPGEENKRYRQIPKNERRMPGFSIPGEKTFIEPWILEAISETKFENYVRDKDPAKVEGYSHARKGIMLRLVNELKTAIKEGEKPEEILKRGHAKFVNPAALALGLSAKENGMTPERIEEEFADAADARQGTALAMLLAKYPNANKSKLILDRNKAVEALLNPDTGDPTVGDLPDGTGTNALQFATNARSLILLFAHDHKDFGRFDNREMVENLTALITKLENRVRIIEEAKKKEKKEIPVKAEAAKAKDDEVEDIPGPQSNRKDAQPEYLASKQFGLLASGLLPAPGPTPGKPQPLRAKPQIC